MNWKFYRERLSTNLWVIPGAAALLAVGLARGVALLDRKLIEGSSAWYLFAGQPDSARELLSTIASSMLTFTGVVFSITILVLQLASSQFSPRVLRTFLRDRFTRVAMGVFIGSFVYALVLLPEVRDGGAGDRGFVPGLAVYVSFLLALLSVLVFIRYIHQMAQSIRVVHIVRRVGGETRESIGRLHPEPFGAGDVAADAELSREGGTMVGHVGRGGVVVTLDEERLLACLAKHGACARFLPLPGSFVPEGAPLFELWCADDREDLARELRAATVISNERTTEQDPGFGFRQLVDVAERALSPGVNDPTTAVQALDQLHDLLRLLVTRSFPLPARRDRDGSVRLFVPRPSWEDYVELAFEEIEQYGRDSLQVRRRIRSALEDLLSIAPEPRRAALARRLTALDAVEQAASRGVAARRRGQP